MRKIALTLVLTTLGAQGQVTGVGNFIHNVADLDKSIAFYHDVLGLELQRPASAFVPTPEIMNLYNAIGGEFRVGSFVIPDTPMRIELVEFRGVERKPFRPKAGPGASILVFQVPDPDAVVARARAAGVKTTTADPIAVPGRRTILFPDPDGFLIQLVQPAVAPAFAPEPGKPLSKAIQLMSFTYIVNSAAKMTPVFAALGLRLEKAAAFNGSLDLNQMGAAQGILRRATAHVPVPDGAVPFRVDFIEVTGTPASTARGRLQDPGAAVLRLLVRDEDAAVRAAVAAGAGVASARGEIVTLPGGNPPRRAVIVSVPDNLFLQVLQ